MAIPASNIVTASRAFVTARNPRRVGIPRQIARNTPIGGAKLFRCSLSVSGAVSAIVSDAHPKKARPRTSISDGRVFVAPTFRSSTKPRAVNASSIGNVSQRNPSDTSCGRMKTYAIIATMPGITNIRAA